METKDPLQRPDAASDPAPLPPLLIGRRLRGLLEPLAKNRPLLAGLLGLVVGGGGTMAFRPTHHPVVFTPTTTAIALRQTMVPAVVDGCQYWLFMMGEPTNANFTASLTHSGSCTNWMAHQAYMR